MWELILTGLIAAVVPTTLVWFLSRKREDRKFSLETKQVEATVFDSISGRLEAMLTRADEQLKAQGEKLDRALERIGSLEQDREAERQRNRTLNSKLDKLRNLLRSYTMRVGIPLTDEEQAIFDETDPEWADQGE